MLTIAGLHVPVTPFTDVVGNTGAVLPSQIESVPRLNVGVSIGFTVTVNVVGMINNQSTGWDGKHQGKPQPVGVYVYAVEATMTDGRKVRLKGNITLIR